MALFKKSLTINELTELSLALCENRYNNISQYLKEQNLAYNDNLLTIVTFFINKQIIKTLLKQVYSDSLTNDFSIQFEKLFSSTYIKSNIDEFISYSLYLNEDLEHLLNDFSNSNLEDLAKYYINEIQINTNDKSLLISFETILLSWKSQLKFIINDYKIKH